MTSLWNVFSYISLNSLEAMVALRISLSLNKQRSPINSPAIGHSLILMNPMWIQLLCMMECFLKMVWGPWWDHPLDPHPSTAVANLCSRYGMSLCFVSLHPYQVRQQYLHRKHPSSCNGGPPLSITYLQMTFGHLYCASSPAGIVHRHCLSLLPLCFQD